MDFVVPVVLPPPHLPSNTNTQAVDTGQRPHSSSCWIQDLQPWREEQHTQVVNAQSATAMAEAKGATCERVAGKLHTPVCCCAAAQRGVSLLVTTTRGLSCLRPQRVKLQIESQRNQQQCHGWQKKDGSQQAHR